MVQEEQAMLIPIKLSEIIFILLESFSLENLKSHLGKYFMTLMAIFHQQHSAGLWL